LFAVGIVLFVITFFINSIASRLVGGKRMRRRGGQL
jgi:ABC-type phosphate transport system permease subunit